MARLHAARLLRDALRLRDRVRLDLALDLLVPPLSLLASAVAVGLVAALALRSIPAAPLFAASAFFLVGYVIRGWMVSGTGARGLLALLCAPGFVAWKLAILAVGSRSKEWVRTAREHSSEAPTPGVVPYSKPL